jgi:hypothetical protein
LIQILEFALPDLLPYNVDVIRAIVFLEELDRKAWEKTDGDSQQSQSPEGQRSVNFSPGFVKLERCFERRVNTSPCEDEESADADNQEEQPIPTVRVEEDVTVDNHNGGTSNENAHSCTVVEIMTVAGNEGGRCKYEI